MPYKPSGKINKDYCRSTFHTWRIYEPSEPVGVSVDEYKDYQSEYVFHYNYIMDRGWKREDKKWVSPCGKYKHVRIYDAYRYQRFCEDVLDG